MRYAKAVLTLLLTGVLVYALNTKFGDVPPLGKFLSPFTGFWRNAEPPDVASRGSLGMEGLQDRVEVLIDDRLVPHVFAQNDHDLYFAQGYLTAKDRLWQMELQTHVAAGRVSEIVGPKALPLDRYHRQMGMGLGARQTLAGFMADPDTKVMAEAYSAGVNAYITSLSPRDYPVEYKLLDYGPEPWSPFKSALLLKLMTMDLAGKSDDYRMSNILQEHGPEVVQNLFPNYPSRMDPIIPPGTRYDFEPLPVPPAPAFVAGKEAQSPVETPDPGIGSNNWAIGADKSATGYPILANDPHLRLSLPSIWYQMQLVGPGVNVYGATIPGAAGVVIGFNEQVSWGVTNVDADVMDWYEIRFKDSTQSEYWHDGQWKPVRQVVEEIKVRGQAPVLDTILYTHHGPIAKAPAPRSAGHALPTGRAMRWIAHELSNEYRTLYEINRAHNYTDFVQAISHWVGPAQNFIYADVHQDIAIWPNGKFPLKWPGQGKFVLDGTDPSHDWQGWVPHAHNPHVKNPPRGFVSSANQHLTDPSYPYYINWRFDTYERGARINERLAAMQQATPDSLRLLQNDNLGLHARDALPTLLTHLRPESLRPEERQALAQLADWTYHYHSDQVGPTVFELWWYRLSRAIWEDEFGTTREVTRRYPDRTRTVDLIRQEPEARWFDNVKTPQKETLTELVQQTFTATVDSLQRQHGPLGEKWRWGNHKSTAIQHLAQLPGFGRNNLNTGGGRGIVNATSERAGPSWRMVVALGPEVKGYGVYPGGQSGNPGSPYYDNLLAPWRRGELLELLYFRRPDEQNDQIISRWEFSPKNRNN
ncbi:penicillin acylase family protein [soil metagenome]